MKKLVFVRSFSAIALVITLLTGCVSRPVVSEKSREPGDFSAHQCSSVVLLCNDCRY